MVDARYNEVRTIGARSGEIVQIFSNVVSNAIDAMLQGGRLMISTTQKTKGEREGVEIVVCDTGRGIRREDLGKVFEPFFTTKGNLGTGIGLWVARELTEGHGGQISISSNTEPSDSGTTVTIYLPLNGLRTKVAANGLEPGTESQ